MVTFDRLTVDGRGCREVDSQTRPMVPGETVGVVRSLSSLNYVSPRRELDTDSPYRDFVNKVRPRVIRITLVRGQWALRLNELL